MRCVIKANEAEAYLARHLGRRLLRGNAEMSLLVLTNPQAAPCAYLSIVTVAVADLSTAEAKADAVQRLRGSAEFESLQTYVNNLWHKSGIPAIVVMFEDKDITAFDMKRSNDSCSHSLLDTSTFLCGYPRKQANEDSLIWRDYNGAQLAKRLHELLRVTQGERGAIKDTNKGLHDYFHLWSREMLSPRIIKFDLDSVYLNDERGDQILIEYKRSSIPPLAEWDPYLADYAHFEGLKSFARQIHARLWLIHQEELERQAEGSTEVLLYAIDSLDENAKQAFMKRGMKYGNYFIGDKKRTTLREIVNAIEGASRHDGQRAKAPGRVNQEG